MTVEITVAYGSDGKGAVWSLYADLPGIPRIGDKVAVYGLQVSETFSIDRADALVDEVIWYTQPGLESPWMPERAKAFIGCRLLDPDDNAGWHLDETGMIVVDK